VVKALSKIVDVPLENELNDPSLALQFTFHSFHDVETMYLIFLGGDVNFPAHQEEPFLGSLQRVSILLFLFRQFKKTPSTVPSLGMEKCSSTRTT